MIKHVISVSLICACSLGALAQSKPTSKTAVKPSAKPTTSAAPAKTAATPATDGLKTALDSLSYAIGVLDAQFFKGQGIDKVNYPIMNKGFADALAGRPTLLTPEQAEMTLREQLQALMRKKIEGTVTEGNQFLAQNKTKPGVKVTPSGLQYEVIREGSGARPADTSTVRVHYEGFLLNGKKFDSSRDRGTPAEFPLNRVIRGWTEGVQLMTVGSRYKFYIPYQLGYGEQGAPPTIPGGSTLVFDVELLDIIK